MQVKFFIVLLVLMSFSCRQQGGVRDLLAEQSTSNSENLTEQQRETGLLVRAYFPALGEGLNECNEDTEGLAYIDTNRNVKKCQNGEFQVVVTQLAVGEALAAGRVYEIGIQKNIIQELKIQNVSLAPLSACEGKITFDKEVAYCLPVLRNTDSVYGAFRPVNDCKSSLIYQGVRWSPAGTISALGPSGVMAQITCQAGETQAQAVARGAIVSACSAGSYSGSLGLCTPCAAGFYQDQSSQTSCKPCSNSIASATGVTYSTVQVGLTMNTCEIISATCESGMEYNATEKVCSPIGTLFCPAGKQASGGTCINCPPGTYKPTADAASCTACSNNILYGQSPIYSIAEFGLTSNSCQITSSSCIAGFAYNAMTKLCEANSFVGNYTTPIPPANLNVCQGSVTVTGSLIACYNLVGEIVNNALCSPVGGSQTYQSPAGSIDAESNGLFLGLIRDNTRVQSVALYCPQGQASKTIESSNFNSLLTSNEVLVNCQTHFADPFLQSTQISCRSQIKKIAGSTSSTCALLENGKVVCWGIQQNGVLGNAVNSTAVYTNATFPRNVTAVCKNLSCTQKLEGVIDISANASHICAIDAQNDAYCWGSNTNAKLGDGSTTLRSIATPVLGGYKFSKVSVGVNHTCAIETVTRKVLCWGLNTNGELGYGTFNATASNLHGTVISPTYYVTTSTVSTEHLTEVYDLALGDAFSCAIVGLDRRLFCWGRGTNGRTGLNTTSVRSFASPVKIDYVSDVAMVGVQQVSVNSTHACAIVGNTRALYCWGNGANLRLGTGNTTNQQIPQLISTPETPQIVSVGATSSCLSSLNGTVYCVGRNNAGQLGYGTYSTTTGNPDNEKATFQQVLSSESLGAQGLFAGTEFYCALNQNKIPFCWGTNNYRQLNDNSTTLRPAPVKMDFF